MADITAQELIRLLDYNPITGEWWWRRRPVDLFEDGEKQSAAHNCAIWNGKFAGKRAGHLGDDGYWTIRVKYKLYQAKRLAWLYMIGGWPPDDVDHKNLNRSDDRWENLRIATHQQNSFNCAKKKNNKVGLKGVHKHQGKYRARIQVDGKSISLGVYGSPTQAHLAYAEGSKKYHGGFGRSA